jgi:phosphoribosylaminoimidazolecarboxamide formyltransferase/IMP cyclohydrolase
MLRSAAKNFRFVAAVTNPARYKEILEELQRNACILSDALLKSLAVDVFKLTSRYDSLIYEFLKGKTSGFPLVLRLELEKLQDLRYGENPHQRGAFYREFNKLTGLSAARQLQGKELSFNNILDLDSAWSLANEFSQPACVIVKHNNPCGVAVAKTLLRAFKDAWACDKLSAFGGIIGLNKKVNVTTARAVLKSGFIECIIAPDYDKGALKLFRQKKNIRVMEMPDLAKGPEWDLKKVSGGLLLQDKDTQDFLPEEAKIATEHKPTQKQWEALLFAWKVAKHTKSNAIILAKGTKTVGIGVGQMSRVDSVYIAIKKAGSKTKGSVLASDAFFPKEDAVQTAIKAGVKAIIHPGGSIADEEIIKVAKKARIVMVLTGMRHFRH